MTHLQSASVICSPGTPNRSSHGFGSPLGCIVHSGGNMSAPMEQQQAAAAQMLRLPHQAAHQRQQHHQGAQPQRQPQARQVGAGQAQRPEAPRAPAAPPASGPGPSYLGSAPAPFIWQPQEQVSDSPEGEWLPPAGRSWICCSRPFTCMHVALCPSKACMFGWECCRCTTVVGAASCHLEPPYFVMGRVRPTIRHSGLHNLPEASGAWAHPCWPWSLLALHRWEVRASL